jgi:uncharacterized protein YbjT (DUF2867 family)
MIKNILVLGGSGFIGRHLVDRLVAQDCAVCVPTRRRAYARELLVLPTVEVVEADILDPAVLARLVAGRDAVINLVGILHDTGGARAGSAYGPSFAATHVTLVKNLVEACRRQGVARLVHVSALGASPQGPSGYLRSKGEGERVVGAAADLQWTILRPSVVFGPDDEFLNLFARLAAWLPVLAIGGADCRIQPVAVADVATAICHALFERATYGRGYELCGPAIYTLRELAQFAARASGHPRLVIGLPGPIAQLAALFFELLPGPTILSRDSLRTLQVDSVSSVQPYRPADELGVHPTPMEPQASLYLAGMHPRTRMDAFRAHARR